MTVSWYHRSVALGATGPDVELVQRRLRMLGSGTYDQETEARVRAVQKRYGLPITGVIDSETAEAIGESERYGLVPDWYERDLEYGDWGDDVDRLRYLLGISRAGIFDQEVDNALRRLQSQNAIIPSGRLTEVEAILLGDEVPIARL